MATYYHKIRIQCPHCGKVLETEDSREFDDDDDLFMYTGGVVTGVNCSCGERIEITDALFRDGKVTLLEPEAYFRYLENHLPGILLHEYAAPDRASWKYGKVTTAEWYRRFINRLLMLYPDNPDLNKYMRLVNAVSVYGTRYLTRVELAGSVTSPGMIPCHSTLKKAYLREGIRKIGDRTFLGCPISDIFLPRTVTEVGESAFEDCTILADLHVSDNLQIIGKNAFRNCRRLGRFFVPDSLAQIGEGAFHGCAQLKELYIPAGCSQIGGNAFGDCPNLKLKVHRGSAAQRYAEENQIPHTVI